MRRPTIFCCGCLCFQYVLRRSLSLVCALLSSRFLGRVGRCCFRLFGLCACCLFFLFLSLRFLLCFLLFLLSLSLDLCCGVATFILLFRFPRLFLLLLDPLDSGIQIQREIDEAAQPSGIFLFPSGALGLVLLFRVPLIITAVSQFRLSTSGHRTREKRERGNHDQPIASLVHLLVQIFKRPPTIKVVPKVVKRFHLVLGVIKRP